VLVTGFPAIQESLRRGSGGELLLCRSGPRHLELERLAREAGVSVRRLECRELDRLTGGADHRGAALRLEAGPKAGPAPGQEAGSARPGLRERLAALGAPTVLLLFLDQVNDPHNFGAILRSADQFGVELTVIPGRRSVRETATVLKTSSGASQYTPVECVPNLVAAMELAREAGFWLYGADLNGESVERVRFAGRAALVLGSEGAGLRRLVRERCDALVRIPAAGHVDSFNVSVAAGILLYEIRRQQRFPGCR